MILQKIRCYWRSIIIGLLGLLLSLTLGNSVSSETQVTDLVREARQHYQQGEFQSSLKILQQIAARLTKDRRILQRSQIQSLISLNQQQLGEWKQAQKAIDFGLALIATESETIEKQQIKGQIWNAQGHLHLRKGQFEKALTSWNKAETFYKKINDDLGFRGIQLARTQALEKLGFYRRACNNVLAVLDKDNYDCQQLNSDDLKFILNSVEQQNSPLKIASLSKLANSLMLLGKLEQAKQTIQQSKILFTLSNLSSSLSANKIRFTEANIARARANLARERNDPTTFIKEQQLAIAAYQSILENSNPQQLTDIVEAKTNLLNIYVGEQKWNIARNLVVTSNLIPQEIPTNYRTLKIQLTLAESLTILKEKDLLSQSWNDIAMLYRDIAQKSNELGNYRLESLAIGSLGQIAYEQQLDLNIDPKWQIERALQIAQTNQAPEIAYRWQWQLGRIYRQRQNIPEALIAYEAAFSTLKSLRSDLVALDREIQFSFRRQVEPLYREYTELLLREQEPSKITSVENLKQAREVIEALQLAELDNYFRDTCVASQTRDIEEIDPSAAVIYTISLPGNKAKSVDYLEVILSLPDGSFHHHEVAVPRSQLSDTINLLDRYLLQPDRLQDTNRLSHQVYDWLIEPLETALSSLSFNINTLVFVLDGELQNIPMSALYDGKQYLLEKYAIALAPGLRLLNAPTPTIELTALAGGVSQPRANFAALENVKTELATIDRTLDTQTLLNAQFNRENFAETLNSQPFSIVHLATHGQFSSNPEQTFILLWDRRLTIEDLSFLLQNRSLDRSQPIDLLVLSACETARGDRRAALGLAGMSVRTGVNSTLATLWQVSDRSTAMVMNRFYDYLSQNPQMNKAEALRLAQLDLWQISQQDWQVPLFWAAYVMVGNWL